jgi:hypothetical protein
VEDTNTGAYCRARKKLPAERITEGATNLSITGRREFGNILASWAVKERTMGRALRREQCDPQEACIVHAIQRCVRRAFLAGIDHKTGKNYSCHQEWIRRRMESTASDFGIDVLGYAIHRNHLHVILRNRPDVAAQWSDQEVAIRWLRMFPGRRLEEHLAEPTESDVQMLVKHSPRLTEFRRRLSDISWFMRALSEPIARMTGRKFCFSFDRSLATEEFRCLFDGLHGDFVSHG